MDLTLDKIIEMNLDPEKEIELIAALRNGAKAVTQGGELQSPQGVYDALENEITAFGLEDDKRPYTNADRIVSQALDAYVTALRTQEEGLRGSFSYINSDGEAKTFNWNASFFVASMKASFMPNSQIGCQGRSYAEGLQRMAETAEHLFATDFRKNDAYHALVQAVMAADGYRKNTTNVVMAGNEVLHRLAKAYDLPQPIQSSKDFDGTQVYTEPNHMNELVLIPVSREAEYASGFPKGSSAIQYDRTE